MSEEKEKGSETQPLTFSIKGKPTSFIPFVMLIAGMGLGGGSASFLHFGDQTAQQHITDQITEQTKKLEEMAHKLDKVLADREHEDKQLDDHELRIRALEKILK